MHTLTEEPLPDLSAFSNVTVQPVRPETFDHGGTRKQGFALSSAPYVLCMTQDAAPVDERLIENLLKGFETEKAAVVYGRQLPREGASELEKLTRIFNYPAESSVKDAGDLPRLGVKTYFCSNVCALYDRRIFESLGGFITKTIFNEDMIYAAKAVKAGYRIVYRADAAVKHSHNYSGVMQFRRNFDLGVSQADHPEVFREVSSEREGGKLVRNTVKTLCKNGRPWLIFPFIWQCGMKFLGYRFGKQYKKFSIGFCRKCSMNKNYWEDNQNGSD